MRLLSRQNGKLRFSRRSHERYAILSHRWLTEEEEVSYTDILNDNIAKPGYRKIGFCLDQAERDGHKHVWIDSCCIDRDKSAELSESLNSMFRWYREAEVCYVYLSDVANRAQLVRSSWFTRGWTLQELIAPQHVRFYTRDKSYLGDKDTLSEEIQIASRCGTMDAPVAERFSWSLNRQTTRPEDKSYCMLGLLDIMMTPIYGEGEHSAQDRLLEKIEKKYGRAVVRDFYAAITLAAQGANIAAADKESVEEALLNSLKFDNMNLRRSAIVDPYPNTCEWFLSHEVYQQWLNRTAQRFLWIKGKPGSGKSTLVKFADSQEADVLCPRISFYFNARGTELERSTTGMFRSLLFQVLQADSDLRPIILQRLTHEQHYAGRSSLSLPSLQNAFREAVCNLQRPTQCFIDALDECAEYEVQDMVHFLEDLSKIAPLYVFFASRYYPSVVIDSPELHLDVQQDHIHDLEDYVNGRLHSSQSLRRKVIDKANGVFMWAVIVVKRLNNDIAGGSLYKAQQTLDTLPSELEELFRTIAARQDDQQRFCLCMQWILYSFEQLPLSTFCIGVLLGLQDPGAKECALSILRGDITHDVEVKWLAIWSRGLIEPIDRDNAHTVVQVIHETVRDYFLHGEGHLVLHSDRSTDVASQVHDSLKQACMCALPLLSESIPTSLCNCAFIWYDFMFYVQQSMFMHAEYAARDQDLPQDKFIRALGPDRVTLICWAHDPEHRLRYRVSDWQSGLFALLVDAHAISLIQIANRIGLAPRAEDELFLIVCASQTRNAKVLKALVDCDFNINVQDDDGYSALMVVCSRPADKAAIEVLLDHGADPELKDTQGRSAYTIAQDEGQEAAIWTLMRRGAVAKHK